MTFLSPNVGGHQPPLKGSRFHHPKKVTIAELPGLLFLYISRFFFNMISRSSAVQGQPWTPRDLSCGEVYFRIRNLEEKHLHQEDLSLGESGDSWMYPGPNG